MFLLCFWELDALLLILIFVSFLVCFGWNASITGILYCLATNFLTALLVLGNFLAALLCRLAIILVKILMRLFLMIIGLVFLCLFSICWLVTMITQLSLKNRASLHYNFYPIFS